MQQFQLQCYICYIISHYTTPITTKEVEFFVFIMYSQKCININITLDALCALQSQYKDNHMVGPSLGKEGKAP